MKINIKYQNEEEALSKALQKLPTQNFKNVLEELNIPQFSFFNESIGGFIIEEDLKNA